jgi:undecaprenyl pyrophosphate phosphatase UppP
VGEDHLGCRHVHPARRIETPDQRLGWLLIVAAIPAGIAGVLLEHSLRVVFAKPLATAGFLVINGLILLCGEWVRPVPQGHPGARVRQATAGGRRLDNLGFRVAGMVGVAQAFALLPGISRSGITMVAGLVRGLDHEDSARFSFLLATPFILATGVYKLPDLLGSQMGMASVRRSSPGAWRQAWPPITRFASWPGTSRPGRSPRSRSTASSLGCSPSSGLRSGGS